MQEWDLRRVARDIADPCDPAWVRQAPGIFRLDGSLEVPSPSSLRPAPTANNRLSESIRASIAFSWACHRACSDRRPAITTRSLGFSQCSTLNAG